MNFEKLKEMYERSQQLEHAEQLLGEATNIILVQKNKIQEMIEENELLKKTIASMSIKSGVEEENYKEKYDVACMNLKELDLRYGELKKKYETVRDIFMGGM